MSEYVFHANSPSDTDRLGDALAKVLPDGVTVGLNGTLGAGKTHLVRAIVAACGVPPEGVVSPTYVLCQEYHGTRTVYHLDVYRLKDEDEFLNLGPDEYFESNGLTLIEWSDRFASCLPEVRLDLQIEVVDDERRSFRFRSVGDEFLSVLTELEAELRPG